MCVAKVEGRESCNGPDVWLELWFRCGKMDQHTEFQFQPCAQLSFEQKIILMGLNKIKTCLVNQQIMVGYGRKAYSLAVLLKVVGIFISMTQ